jgi:hypothetical protein
MDYKKIAEEALRKAKEAKANQTTPTKPVERMLNEGLVYGAMTERMHPKLEDDLIKDKTSLGKHPIFPEGHEDSFTERIMGDRFKEVVNRYKRHNDVDEIDNEKVKGDMLKMLKETMSFEQNNKKALEKLAVDMVREEFDMDEDMVEIEAVLTEDITLEGTKKNPLPAKYDMEFKNHDELVKANKEVYKRRFVNAMIQGAAKKCHHMFQMVEDELSDINPKLPNAYSKLMSAADYMYYIQPNMEDGIAGGIVRVEYPTKDNPKVKIIAHAMVFPVLIHELVKGVMEVLSAKGLPKKKMGEFVINKADFLAAEPWDMRIGPALWERFTDVFEAEDFHLKHHVYNDLVELPVDEFNKQMKEIMAGTKEGKKLVKTMVEAIKKDISNEDFNETMETIQKDIEQDHQTFNLDELLGNGETEDDSYNLEDLL